MMIDLEIKWFYRLVKVMYVFFLAIGFISVLCIAWSLKPYQLLDTRQSYLTCPDGTKHSFDSLGLYFYTKSRFSDYDSEKAIKECNKHLKKPAAVADIAPGDSSDLSEWEVVHGNPYPTDWIYKTEGSWISAIKFMLFGSMIVFLIFNVIKQSLLYIVYGKKFTFNW